MKIRHATIIVATLLLAACASAPAANTPLECLRATLLGNR